MIKSGGLIRRIVGVILLMGGSIVTNAQAPKTDATQLFNKMRTKIALVKDYVADVKMKIDVSFMRVPLLAGKLYFKAPGKIKLERNGGISILPKESINLTLGNLIPAGNAVVIDMGYEKIDNRQVRVMQVVPQDVSDIVLTKLWLDEARMVVLRTETTTRDNGTVKMDLEFNSHTDLALPDHVVFRLDIKDYKLPKGVTMDYDDGSEKMMKKAKKLGANKGTIDIRYLKYDINKGLSDAIFVRKAQG